jgi:hypothetical protein
MRDISLITSNEQSLPECQLLLRVVENFTAMFLVFRKMVMTNLNQYRLPQGRESKPRRTDGVALLEARPRLG